MARKSDRALIDALTREWEPRIRDAFIQSIRSITDTATIRVIADRLGRGDVFGAVEALGLDADAFGPLDLTIAGAYYGSGQAQVDAWPLVRDADGAAVVFRFGVRNNEAENWLRLHSSTMVTRIIEDQRAAIRIALAEGLSAGLNPRAVALDIVGRINRQTGRREGGIVGLDMAQTRFVANARAELADPDAMRNYFGRSLRDKRFDRTVAKAIREGRALDAATISKIVGRYSDTLLRQRGERIARTEMLAALNKARDDAIRQQVLAGKLDAMDVTKVWQAALDGRTRDTHRALHGQKIGLEGAFQSPSGATLRYPGDPDAPPEEHINCRCWLQLEVDFLAGVVRQQRAA